MRTFKPSKAPWLDEVPSAWDESPLFTYFRARKQKNRGMAESNVLSLSYGRIKRRDVDSGMGLLPESFETYQIVEPGDIVMRLTDLQNDKRSLRTGLVGERGIVTSAYVALVANERTDPRFAHYLLHSLDTRKVFYGLGAGVRQTMGYDDLSGMPLAMPPLSAQRSVADYLDSETARIDALIDRKQRFIDLLLEKRTALITHAVTKGLDPNAEMKDSGIGHFSVVPTTWTRSKLGRIGAMSGGCTPSKENRRYWDGAIPWVTPKDMKVRRLEGAIDHVTDEALTETSLSLIAPGAILVVVRGMILARRVPVALNDLPVTVNQDMKAIRVAGGLNPEFILYLLEGMSSALQTIVEEAAHGTRCLRAEVWKAFPIMLPSLREQNRIVSHLGAETRVLDTLVDRTHKSIDLLREYRTALISAAVTGQIDIPGTDETEDVA